MRGSGQRPAGGAARTDVDPASVSRCVLLAVWWAVPPPPGRQRRDRLDRAAVIGRTVPRSGRVRALSVCWSVAPGGDLLAGILGRTAGSGAGPAAVVVGSPSRGLLRPTRGPTIGAAGRSTGGPGLLVAGLASAGRAVARRGAGGRRRSTARCCARRADALELGGDPVRVWRQQADAGRARRAARAGPGLAGLDPDGGADVGHVRPGRGRACRRTRACARWSPASCRHPGRPAR